MTTTEISVIRTPHTADRPYFLMARATAQDETLSWEARGVLSYLLSKPDDWQVQVKDLQQQCGKDKVKSILKELEAAGYLEVERDEDNKQLHDPQGHFAPNRYRVHETPHTVAEKPSTVQPSTVNPPLTYKRSKQNRELQSAPPNEPETAITKSDYKDVPDGARKILINAWNSNLPTPHAKPFDEKLTSGKKNHYAAAAIHRAGYTPEQVEAFVQATFKEDFWQGKTLTLEKVLELLPAWLKRQAPPKASGIWSRRLTAETAVAS